MKNRLVGMIAVLMGIAFLILLALNCLVFVEVGENGVVSSGLTGNIREKTLDPGLHMKWPWEQVTKYPVITRTTSLVESDEDEKKEANLKVQTADGRSIEMKVAYTYRIDPGRLTLFYQKVGGQKIEQWEQQELGIQVKSAVQEAASRYNAVDIFSNKSDQVRKTARQHLSSILYKDGIVLENIVLTDIRVDDEVKKILQKTYEMQLQLEHLKQMEAIKQQEAINRQLEAESKKKEMLIKAEAQAEANRILQKSLNWYILEYEKIKKWDGKGEID